MKIRKIYVIAAMHGDEPFGLKIMGHLRHLGDGKIITKVGHPEAVAKRREFIETNLNRSFGPNIKPSKEARIAQHILEDIKSHDPDLIIDLHTCECKVGKSAIIAKEDPKLIKIAKRLSMEHVFIGVPSLSRVSLIGQYPAKTILLEFGIGLRSDKLAEDMANKIADLLNEKTENLPDALIPVYSESRLIKKDEAGDMELVNYELNEKLGGYPYLVGKNTYGKYTNYIGFLAKKQTKH